MYTVDLWRCRQRYVKADSQYLTIVVSYISDTLWASFLPQRNWAPSVGMRSTLRMNERHTLSQNTWYFLNIENESPGCHFSPFSYCLIACFSSLLLMVVCYSLLFSKCLHVTTPWPLSVKCCQSHKGFYAYSNFPQHPAEINTKLPVC